ncbi:MAG: hypothetical protein ACKOC4_14135 [Planctomycetia bacterium]
MKTDTRLVCGLAPVLAAACLLAATGCKTDLSQQLLERELRYQEDQIYALQDELDAKAARLERVAGENASLRKQLGVSDGDAAAPPRTPPSGRGSRPAATGPVLVPPAIEEPDAPLPTTGKPRTGVPDTLAPPALDGVPPLPGGGAGASSEPLTLPPPAALDVPSATPALPATGGAQGTRLSFEEPATPPVRLVVNPSQTLCRDADGDGRSDGITVVFEPRDAEERLVPVAGDIAVLIYDLAGPLDPVTGEPQVFARFEVPAADAAGHFRRTSRARGMHFDFGWPGTAPAGDAVRVVVRVAAPAGLLEADATVGTTR